ncbi:SDR family NAD(P)-dependent oxidoreductase [Kribbella yunnanensis]|uniref:SDR family NAD(P)-dependent oxidoreductase n=1 Tax=Kribbella yunnanensis TaxID=190194 RepID=A0ABP4UYP8_9ACTN
MAPQPWTVSQIPDQYGRIAVVTGANTGLGFAAADGLAQCGAVVVLACRNDQRATAAADRIRTKTPGALIHTLPLDLASLSSIRAGARRLREDFTHIDLLVNNAGAIRRRHSVTADGFESTMAVNHLGPFAFTGLVLDLLTGTPGSRIVTVSSNAHRRATIDPGNLDPDRHGAYRFSTAYGRTKLANLLFTYELNRRLKADRASTIAVAAHAGLSRTEGGREMNWVIKRLSDPKINPIVLAFSQSAEMGALATLRAATDPLAGGGDYYGPTRRGGLIGNPEPVDSSQRSHNEELQRQLWEQSERLTGVTYPLGAP